ncbi:MAG: hypothetical protein H6600_05525 [Flavobacteriales bacterium]|nr:hypothetical protein [Flavobacteriales bacterium]
MISRYKIFCISFQRTGTTSVGGFFKDQGFRVADYGVSRKNEWGISAFEKDYEKIFSSRDFKKSRVFEDGPWWYDDLYKVLFFRFPTAKFVLLTRDADHWFDSMVNHSGGKTLGNSYIHAFLYRREKEWFEKHPELIHVDQLRNDMDLDESHRELYQNTYNIRIKEILNFFRRNKGEDRLFVAELYDEKLWQKMGTFFNIPIKDDYISHRNKTNKTKN